jgi:hypothetical protein
MHEYRTVLFINGQEVFGSACCNGPRAKCDQAASRLNRSPEQHPAVTWRVVPCIDA